jgi:hypothetical protein
LDYTLKQIVDNTKDEFQAALDRLKERIYALEQQWGSSDDLANIQERVEEVTKAAFEMKGHADFCAGLEVARDRLKGDK